MIKRLIALFLIGLGLPMDNYLFQDNWILRYQVPMTGKIQYLAKGTRFHFDLQLFKPFDLKIENFQFRFLRNIEKQAPDKIFFEDIKLEAQFEPPRNNNPLIGSSSKRVISPRGDIIGSKEIFNHDIIVFPEKPVNEASGWFGSVDTPSRIAFFDNNVTSIIKNQDKCFVEILSQGFDLRKISSLFLNRMFISKRIVPVESGFHFYFFEIALSVVGVKNGISSNLMLSGVISYEQQE